MQSPIDGHKNLNMVFESVKAADSIAASIYLQQAYETDYGIEDHERHNASPLSTVLYRDTEHYLSAIQHGSLMREYRKNKIKDYFGISFNEYITEPPYICELMINEVKSYEDELERIKEEVERDAQRKSNNPLPGI